MKKLYTLLIILASVSLSAQTVFMPNDIFENICESNGWGDGIIGNDLVDEASIALVTYLDLSNLLIDDYTGLESFTSLTGFDCSNVANQGIANTSISLLPISSQLLTLDVGKSSTFCIEVADITQASANVSSGLWIIDSHASFSTDCASTTFWSNDFSNASDWTMVDLLNGGLQNWVITTNGPQGWYSSAMGPIASSTQQMVLHYMIQML